LSAFFWSSVYKWESVLEIYSDAEMFGLKSANPVAVNNSNLAIFWLEATFPELAHESEGELSTLKAHPYAVFDASLCLQVIFILFLTLHIPYIACCIDFQNIQSTPVNWISSRQPTNRKI
jgi:hypothetical protein